MPQTKEIESDIDGQMEDFEILFRDAIEVPGSYHFDKVRKHHRAVLVALASARAEADELRARLFEMENLALEYTDGGILSYQNDVSLIKWKDVTKDNHGREPEFLASKLQRESDSIDPSTFAEPQRQYTEGRKSGLHQAAEIIRRSLLPPAATKGQS